MGYAATFRQIVGRARPGTVIGPVRHLILHHEYGQPLPVTATLAQEKARLRAIDAYHRSLGWAGFGYSTMPCPSGRNLEGRGYRRSGAHTGHMNRTALAAMLPGTDTGMTDGQVDAIRSWYQEGVRQGAITAGAVWSGHRDHMPRDCPGDRNYSQLHRLNDPEDDMTDAERKLLTDTAAAVRRIERRLGDRNDDRATVLDDLGRVREGVRAIASHEGLDVKYDLTDEVRA